MFRKARIQTLVRKVQKYMKAAHSKAQAGFNQEEPEDWSKYINAFTQFIIKNLDENQLKVLLKSLENKGGIHTDCLILPRENDIVNRIGLSSVHVLFCKVLRWPDLISISELKAFINCQNYNVSTRCGNPFHYSRITKQGIQKSLEENSRDQAMEKQPQKEISARFSDDGFSEQEEGEQENEDDRKANAGCSDSQFSSGFQTRQNSDVTTASTYEPWCSIAYWEVKRRIGRVFDVTTDCVNVFYELPQGDGMCIGLLDHVERSAYVNKVRKHIGYGFQLTQEHDGIWIYNRSDYCIFVSAPAFDSETGIQPIVVKPEVIRVPPGYCVHAVDFRRPVHLLRRNRKFDHSVDVFCIRVSFAKGWGDNYTRQYITACPCWTEIYLREPFLAVMGLI
ncbi:mothers against decapentaplegic homolog 7-like [Rhopilema esculentum]|uniref:mothers against decapentaplegic homolog 7-like n=1 Tax=Rhopilema esculentum TaxID=499914 RepID=UPI0031DA9F39